MFGTVLKWMFNRWVLGTVGIVCLCLVVLFLGPLLSLGGWVPFASDWTLYTVIVLILVGWSAFAAYSIHRQRKKNDALLDELENTGGEAAEQETEALRNRFREAIGHLRRARIGGRSGRRFLYELPWYVIIGPPGAGKTTALRNSGLNFPLNDRLGNTAVQGAGGTRNCDWWFTEEAVFLDTAGRYTTQDSDESADRGGWIGFLDLVRRYRPGRPLDGILVAVSLDEILSSDARTLEAHAGAVRRRLTELEDKLKIKAPVYLLLTKSDLLSGFVESYDGLSADEREQVWGVTLPLDISRNPAGLFADFEKDFADLVERVERLSIKRTEDEPSERARAAILSFPAQLQGVAAPLKRFLESAFGESRYDLPVFFRGFYFTSGTQEGTPIDRVLAKVSRSFAVDGVVATGFSGREKAYFLKRLLHDVILDERDLVTGGSFFQRYRAPLEWAGYGAALGVPLLALIGWAFSYSANTSFAGKAGEVAGNVAAVEQRLNPERDGRVSAAELAYLNNLRILPGGFENRNERPSVVGSLGLYQGRKVGVEAEDAYKRGLKTILEPDIAASLEAEMQGPGAPKDTYLALRLYLMLGHLEHLDRDWADQRLTAAAERLLGNDTDAERGKAQLAAHVTAWLDTMVFGAAINEQVVDQARAKVTRVPRADLIYDLVASQDWDINVPDWSPEQELGAAARYFVHKDGEPLRRGVPKLFTKAGYQRIFKGAALDRARELAREEWVFGTAAASSPLDASFERSVEARYADDYGRRWETVLTDIRLRPFDGFSGGIEVADIFSGESSPLVKFFRAVARETDLNGSSFVDNAVDAAASKAQDLFGSVTGGDEERAPQLVANRFKSLHDSLRVDENGGSSLDRGRELFAKLGEALNGQRSGDPSSGRNASNVSADLKAEAKRQPEAIGEMMTQFAQEADQIELRERAAQVNGQWASKVQSYCREALSGRFPFDSNSKIDVNKGDFEKLFASGGLIESFFNDHLQHDIDTSVRPWKAKAAEGSRPYLQPQTVRFFERAARIRNAFFGTGSGDAVGFSLKPLSLSGADEVTLRLGDKDLSYRNGPQRTVRMSWPPSSGEQAVWADFGDIDERGQRGPRARTPRFEGPWAIYRFLSAASVRPVGRTRDRYSFTVRAEQASAAFELRAESVINPFAPNLFKGIQCPNRL